MEKGREEMRRKLASKKPTIEELERILDSEEETPLQIMPNGEIRAMSKKQIKGKLLQPITFRENLGGEYCFS